MLSFCPKHTSEQLSRGDFLHDLAHALEDAGLIYRPDVVVEVSGIPAAWGFSVPACDGLLLLGVLPDTAQSWSHIAPALASLEFEATYLYRGKTFRQAPRLGPLLDRLAHTLGAPLQDQRFSVIAFSEQGECGLSQRAQAVVHQYLNQSSRQAHTHRGQSLS